MKSQQVEVRFDKELHHFLTMAIEIWPTLQSATKHLHEVGSPHPDSFLPQRQYSSMTPQKFTQTVADDLFDFIMTHDVKAEDIQDYLEDVLSLMMIDEELLGGSSNPASIHYMANFTIEVMEQLQEGRRDKVVAFEEGVYRNVKQFKGQVIEDSRNKSQSQSDESQSGSESDEEYSEEQQDEGKQQKKEVVQKSEEQLRRQQQLQDDGWVIVKKKR